MRASSGPKIKTSGSSNPAPSTIAISLLVGIWDPLLVEVILHTDRESFQFVFVENGFFSAFSGTYGRPALPIVLLPSELKVDVAPLVEPFMWAKSLRHRVDHKAVTMDRLACPCAICPNVSSGLGVETLGVKDFSVVRHFKIPFLKKRKTRVSRSGARFGGNPSRSATSHQCGILQRAVVSPPSPHAIPSGFPSAPIGGMIDRGYHAMVEDKVR
jgi:hypothetical protein